MPLHKVVREGVFNPREYKQKDPNWARKRRPDVMGCTGVIKYTRESWEDDTPIEDRFRRRDLVAEYRAKSVSKSPEPGEGDEDFYYLPEQPRYRQPEPEPEYRQPEPEPEPVHEPEPEPPRIQETPPRQTPIEKPKEKIELWPKRVRSDITALYR